MTQLNKDEEELIKKIEEIISTLEPLPAVETWAQLLYKIVFFLSLGYWSAQLIIFVASIS